MATTTVTTVEPETKFASPILPKSNHSLSAPPDEADDDVVRPDIEWIPSHKTYAKRVEQLKLNCRDRQTTLPEGWPEKLDAARVWSGSDFKDDIGKYILQFEESDIAEIENGLAHFKALPHNNDPDNVNTETFPLPTLGAKLNDVSKQIHDGIGFAVLRGLDPKKYSPRDNILLYVGITSYIAEVRGCQDYDGRMVVHIQDIREDVRDYAKRGPFSPYTSRAQPFHTDRCDILSLYAYDVSPTGGESVIASGGKIYNEIADKRPDIVHLLADDKWIFDEFHNGDYHRRPLLHKFGSHGPGFVYSRRPLTGAWFSPHHPSVPAMSEEQAEALDTVHFTAEKHQLELRLQRGDIELLNNFALFHARREFVDDPSARRHMIRLWLRNKDYAWESPEVVARSGREIYDPNSPFRANPVWDINWSPPLGRGPWKRMECN